MVRDPVFLSTDRASFKGFLTDFLFFYFFTNYQMALFSTLLNLFLVQSGERLSLTLLFLMLTLFKGHMWFLEFSIWSLLQKPKVIFIKVVSYKYDH